MPAWETYLKEARERGALALELYVVISTPVVGPEVLREVLPSHLEYQRKAEENGHLAFAGPMSDETGTQMNGVGMIVYRAESFEQAREITENDPMHAQGARTYELRKWMINEGNVSINVGLSTKSVKMK